MKIRAEDILGYTALAGGLIVDNVNTSIAFYSLALGLFIGSLYNQIKERKNAKTMEMVPVPVSKKEEKGNRAGKRD